MTDTVAPVMFTGPSRGLLLQDGDTVDRQGRVTAAGRVWMRADINPDPDVHWGDDNFGVWVTDEGTDAERFRGCMALYGWREVTPAATPTDD